MTPHDLSSTRNLSTDFTAKGEVQKKSLILVDLITRAYLALVAAAKKFPELSQHFQLPQGTLFAARKSNPSSDRGKKCTTTAKALHSISQIFILGIFNYGDQRQVELFTCWVRAKREVAAKLCRNMIRTK